MANKSFQFLSGKVHPPVFPQFLYSIITNPPRFFNHFLKKVGRLTFFTYKSTDSPFHFSKNLKHPKPLRIFCTETGLVEEIQVFAFAS